VGLCTHTPTVRSEGQAQRRERGASRESVVGRVPCVERGPQCDGVRAEWALWTRLLHRSADGGLAQEMAIGAASVVWDGAAVVDESVCVSTSSSVGWSSVAPGLVLLPCCRSDWPWSETA
jgi:hypothetical protein